MQRAVGFAGPVELKVLHRRIEAWRQTMPGTRPMPEELWKEASGFAQKLGISRVSRALKVGYSGLKRRMQSSGVSRVPAQRRACAASVSRPDFIELSGVAALPISHETPGASDAVLEVVAPDGMRLTIRLKTATSANVTAWVSAFRARA